MSINDAGMDQSSQEKARFEGVKLVAAFNNEEVGSQTRQGADSQLLINNSGEDSPRVRKD